LFLKKRYLPAIIVLGITSIFHSAYLLSAGLMTAAYLLQLLFGDLNLQDLSWGNFFSAIRKPFFLGLLALVCVIPVLWYNIAYLQSTSPELSKQSLHILVHERIPHHSLPEVWFDRMAVLQVAIMMVGVFLARKSRLLPVLLALFSGGLILTLVQIVTENDSLALIAPWRVSVLLVPIGSALILSWLISLLVKYLPVQNHKFHFVLLNVFLFTILYFCYSGREYQNTSWRRYLKRDVVDMMEFVRDNNLPDEIYLIPPYDNEFNDFRLYTGSPIFINWKSHPYLDQDVIEWYQRNLAANEIYTADATEACDLLSELTSNYHLTHIVMEVDDAVVTCPDLVEIYRDNYYVVSALPNP
jgi:hypothetical protein